MDDETAAPQASPAGPPAGSVKRLTDPRALRALAHPIRLSLIGLLRRPVGSLAGGALGTLIGLRPTLWIATIGGLAGFLWLLPSPLPRFRMPDPARPPRQAR